MGTRSRGEKPPPLETMRRRETVESMLAKQDAPSTIQKAVMLEFNVSDRTVRKDITWVQSRWDEEALAAKPSRRHQARMTLLYLLQRTMEAEQWEVARKVMADVIKLDGLDAPIKIEHSGEVDLSKMTSDEKRRETEAMFARGLLIWKLPEPEETEEPAPPKGNGRDHAN